MVSTVSELSVIFGSGADNLQQHVADPSHPLLESIYSIFDYLSIEFPSGIDFTGSESLGQVLESFVKKTECRYRVVTLSGDWWKEDTGPLLAFNNETQQPMVLLPSRKGGYDIYDTVTRVRRRLTESDISTIAADAVIFYRGFGQHISSMKSLFKICIKNHKHDLFFIGLTQVLLGLLALAIPIFTGFIFNHAIPNADGNLLIQFATLLLVLTLATSGFQLVQSIGLMRFRFKLNTSIQAAVWDRILRLPLGFFKKYTAGDLTDRAGGIDKIMDTVNNVILTTLFSSLFSLLSLFLMFYYDWVLGLVVLGLMLPYIALIVVFTLVRLKHLRENYHLEGKLEGLVYQLVKGVTKLRMTNSEEKAHQQWFKDFSKKSKFYYFAARVLVRINVLNALFPTLLLALVFMVVVARGNTLSLGYFVAFNAALGVFMSALTSSTMAIADVIEIQPIFKRLYPVINTEIESASHGKARADLNQPIVLQDVGFRYGVGQPHILRNINLTILPGEFIAIVGPSGAGKSTLLRLLLGFETLTDGEISMGGIPYSGLDLQDMRSQIGTVLQNDRLFPGSILQNIRGNHELTREDIWQLLEITGLKELVSELPMQLETYVSEEGKTFSSGQQQRLLIARALAAKPKLLLLDEATNALDNLTQQVVTTQLEAMQLTRIAIAHRLSTIKNADHIIVMAQGEIVEQGDYQSLLAQQGLFTTLVARQTI